MLINVTVTHTHTVTAGEGGSPVVINVMVTLCRGRRYSSVDQRDGNTHCNCRGRRQPGVDQRDGNTHCDCAGEGGSPVVINVMVTLCRGRRYSSGDQRDGNTHCDCAGEGGSPVVINVSALSSEEKKRYDEGWAHNSFNQYASDMISVHRSLPDNNPEE